MDLSSSLRIAQTALISLSLVLNALFLVFSFRCRRIGTRLCTRLLRSQTITDSLLMLVNLINIQYFSLLPLPSQTLPDWLWFLYCKLVYSQMIHWTLVSMSVYNLVCIAIERCCCLCAPFWYRAHTPLLLKVFVITVLTSPFTVEVPFCWIMNSFVKAEINATNSTVKTCAIIHTEVDPTLMNGFGIAYVTIFWILPSVLSIALYLIILRRIRQSSAVKELAGSNVSGRDTSGATRRLTLMTGVTSAAFVLLFGMDAVHFLLLCYGVSVTYRGVFVYTASFLLNMNSAINPLMFLIFMPKFRSFIANLFLRGKIIDLNVDASNSRGAAWNTE